MDLLDRAIENEDYAFIQFLEDPTLLDRLDKHIIKHIKRLAPTSRILNPL